ncbi:MAG: MerR family transcriptional regulator [Candidatus Eremiobacteraeota bacterium]|uniref:Transcriptional regulator, MerR family n=1 Tax=mine drainage metagenome TaxID=410659 RepID=E6PFI1_9ZZZZ|nr:MerR family transcriptional regulator [Candidatus Eremiobacteraeota bacterium]
MNERYRIGAFARLTGITVRTLHHYDRIGLLRPQGRSDARYRLYGDRELMRLQQIVTLKALGFDLATIGRMLDDERFDIGRALDAQIAMLEERREGIEKIVEAMRAARESLRLAPSLRSERFVRAIQGTLMMNQIDYGKHFTPEQLRALGERSLGETEQANITAAWNTLFSDIAAAENVDPASVQAQALLERWESLVAAFTQNDPSMERSLASFYADETNRTKVAAATPQMPKAWRFVERARIAREAAR